MVCSWIIIKCMRTNCPHKFTRWTIANWQCEKKMNLWKQKCEWWKINRRRDASWPAVRRRRWSHWLKWTMKLARNLAKHFWMNWKLALYDRRRHGHRLGLFLIFIENVRVNWTTFFFCLQCSRDETSKFTGFAAFAQRLSVPVRGLWLHRRRSKSKSSSSDFTIGKNLYDKQIESWFDKLWQIVIGFSWFCLRAHYLIYFDINFIVIRNNYDLIYIMCSVYI